MDVVRRNCVSDNFFFNGYWGTYTQNTYSLEHLDYSCVGFGATQLDR